MQHSRSQWFGEYFFLCERPTQGFSSLFFDICPISDFGKTDDPPEDIVLSEAEIDIGEMLRKDHSPNRRSPPQRLEFSAVNTASSLFSYATTGVLYQRISEVLMKTRCRRLRYYLAEAQRFYSAQKDGRHK